MNNDELFNTYKDKLKAVDGVTSVYEEQKDCNILYLSSNNPMARKVELYHWRMGANFVGVRIEGEKCGYWHTAEQENIDNFIALAIRALQGTYR